jgi:channel protein (hemolysin III family)
MEDGIVEGTALFAGLNIVSIPGFTEPVSSLSHLAGAGLFGVLGFFLIRRGRENPAQLASLAIYALSCVLLFSLSGVYHLLSFGGTARAVLERLDHGAIFMLIAGTFTPVHAILFRGLGRWGVLLLIWTAAVTGITLKTIFFADVTEGLGLVFYMVLGWVGVLSAIALGRRYGIGFIKPLLWGGVAYTLGALVDFLRRPVLIPGVFAAHEVFHFLILIGAGLHWRFVWRLAAGTFRP